MTGIKRLDLNLDSQIRHTPGHIAKHAGRVGHDIVRLCKIHGSAIQRGNFRAADFKVRNALRAGDHVGARILQG